MTNNNLLELRTLLDKASLEDRANLAKIINAGYGDTSELLCDHIQYLRSGFIGQFIDTSDYKKLVTDTADHIQIDWTGLSHGRQWGDLSVAEIEEAIVVKTLQKILGQLSDEDRRRLAEELGKEAQDPSIVGELLCGGAIILGRLSGIQIYILTTTAVGALSSALGITLPFVIYTAATRGLSIVLGPIGWVLLGVSVLLNLNQTNWSRLVPGIVYISYIRQKLNSAN